MLCKMIPISAFANRGFPQPNCERSMMSEDNYLSLSHNCLFVRSKTNFFQKQTFSCLFTNYLHKVNRCLARYSPRATTTNQPTNRAPIEPARTKCAQESIFFRETAAFVKTNGQRAKTSSPTSLWGHRLPVTAPALSALRAGWISILYLSISIPFS